MQATAPRHERTMDAVLYNKHVPCAAVRMSGDGDHAEEILSVYHREALPLILMRPMENRWQRPDKALKELNQWMRKRRVPQDRDGLSGALRICPDLLADQHQFSLTDPYWFQVSASDRWETGNFFDKRYDPVLGTFLFTPWAVEDLTRVHCPSPDRTTNGVLRKHWTQPYGGPDTRSVLIKAGSLRKSRQSPVSEVLASMALERMHIVPFVRYDLVVDGLMFCSRCANFITADTEFVPASHVYNQAARHPGDSIYDHLIRVCRRAGIANAEDCLSAMIAADSIIGNNDRHLGNFGFLRQAETGTIIGFAPLFDFGFAFCTSPAAEGQGGRKPIWTDDEILNARRKTCAGLEEDRDFDTTDLYRFLREVPDLSKEERFYLFRQVAQVQESWRRMLRMGNAKVDRSIGAR